MADPISYKTETRTDGAGNPYQVRIPIKSNPNVGFTGRMDYSTNPQGTFVAVDPNTGLDVGTRAPLSNTANTQASSPSSGIPNTTSVVISPYSSGTGAGTLTDYAKKYGTTVQNLVSLNQNNPSVKNQDLIIAGGKLNVPTTNPTVQTGEKALTAYEKAQEYLRNINQLPPNLAGTPSDPNKKPEKPKDTVSTVIGADSSTPKAPGQEQVDAINESYEATKKSFADMLQTQLKGLKDSQVAAVNSIVSRYSRSIDTQKDTNARMQGGTNVQGIVSGRNRYAPEVQQGILMRQIEDGAENILKLETERDDLIERARTSADEKSLEATFKSMEQLEKAQKTRSDAIADLYKKSMDLEKLSIDIARNKREQLKSEQGAQEDAAMRVAVQVADQVGDFTTEEGQKALQDAATQTGLDASYLAAAISKYRTDQSKALPSSIQEYEYARNQGFSGTLFEYGAAKKKAQSIASGASNKVLTAEEASQIGLPKEIVGLSDFDVIQSLSFSTPPSWFKKYITVQIGPQRSDEQINSYWESFRSDPNVKVYRETFNLSKDKIEEDEELF